MVTAYVLIITRPGAEDEVAMNLLKMKEVKDAGVVYGEYDIVTKVEVPTMEGLQGFILKLRKDKAVERTTTMIVSK